LFTLQGQYADAFLEIGTSPRTIALGQATVAMPNHPAGYLYNPASSGFTPSIYINALYINQFGLADYAALGCSVPIGDKYQLGLQTIVLSIGNIAERPDLMGIQNLEDRRNMIRELTAQGFSYFTDREIAINFNFSRNFESKLDFGWYINEIPFKAPLGLNLRVIQKSLHNLNGFGIGVDLGSMFIVNLKDVFPYDFLGELVVGTSLTNLSETRIFWDSKKEDIIPMQWITGLRYTQSFGKYPLKLALYYQQNKFYLSEDRFGLEWTILNSIFLRLGQNEGMYQSGIGFKIKQFNRTLLFGYSFSNHDLGNAHRIGGSMEL